jgi:general secretion pathway protein H
MTGRAEARLVRGFTLLELLVVLAIAGLLMAAVPPLISAVIPGTELKGATRQLAVSLRHARFSAISRGVPVEITFIGAEPARYVINDKEEQLLPRGATLRIRTHDNEVTGDDPFRLRFFPDGSSNGANILLRREQHNYTVSVDWLMGKIRISQDEPNVF